MKTEGIIIQCPGENENTRFSRIHSLCEIIILIFSYALFSLSKVLFKPSWFHKTIEYWISMRENVQIHSFLLFLHSNKCIYDVMWQTVYCNFSSNYYHNFIIKSFKTIRYLRIFYNNYFIWKMVIFSLKKYCMWIHVYNRNNRVHRSQNVIIFLKIAYSHAKSDSLYWWTMS